MRLLWSLYLRLTGWTLKGSFPYHLKKCVVIVGPHTSSWDFIIGVAWRSRLRLTHAKFLGKAELFKRPFGFIFRKLGGFPVERSENHNMVDQVVNLFNSHDSFTLVLSPEGTRKKVDRLRTGFYYIAKKAGVPIVMTGLDFEKKQASFSEPFFTSDDEAADLQHIYQFYALIKGKKPEQGMAHLLTKPA
ncbi:MAG: 1-acyl-sn-glycerol-3-phosphate acyltransferase [Bacteroidota bacterium]